MLRGIQRKMIIVKTDRSNVFETAYFVLRSELERGDADANDLLAEANRIVSENGTRKPRTEKRRRYGRFAAFCLFMLGAGIGVLASFLAWLIYYGI